MYVVVVKHMCACDDVKFIRGHSFIDRIILAQKLYYYYYYFIFFLLPFPLASELSTDFYNIKLHNYILNIHICVPVFIILCTLHYINNYEHILQVLSTIYPKFFQQRSLFGISEICLGSHRKSSPILSSSVFNSESLKSWKVFDFYTFLLSAS